MRKINFKIILSVFMFALLLVFIPEIKAEATEAGTGTTPTPTSTPTPTAERVRVTEIDYDSLTITVDAKGNKAVYYSDDKQKAWTKIDSKVIGEDKYVLDISWISASKDYELNLKGDINEDVTTVVLPKTDTSVKVKYDKINKCIVFTKGGEGVTKIEWKKVASYSDWKNVTVGTDGKIIPENIDSLLLKGAKIYVRVPQTKGTDEDHPGERPGKSLQVAVTKLPNAPSVKVDVTKLTVNTTDKFEYMVYSVGGEVVSGSAAVFKDCTKKMELADMAPQVLYSENNKTPKDVIIAVRKKATAKAPYSKTAYLTIPAQTAAPGSDVVKVSSSTSEKQFVFSINGASSSKPYQYAVQKEGNTKALSWKKVTSSKDIKLTASAAPLGSKVYIRVMGEAVTSKNPDLVLPSDSYELGVVFKSSTTTTPVPTSAPTATVTPTP